MIRLAKQWNCVSCVNLMSELPDTVFQRSVAEPYADSTVIVGMVPKVHLRTWRLMQDSIREFSDISTLNLSYPHASRSLIIRAEHVPYCNRMV